LAVPLTAALLQPVDPDGRAGYGWHERLALVSSEIDVKLLGPLEVSASGKSVQFEGAKQRALFTLLALRAPDAVPADELVEALWGDHPPAGAAQALQKQISRLRHRLGGASELRHRPAGYALEIDPRAVDTRRFEDLLRRARMELAQGDPARAAAGLREALAQWRGAALADHRAEEFALRDIARLEELRVEAIEERLAAELASGRDADLIGEIQAVVAEHPLRERLRAHLMLALYRAGRQAEALETLREGRTLLVDELGIEPGPELRRLERRILAHDPELTADHPAVLAGPLPAAPNATIGRTGELAEVTELLMRPEVRLVTLVGPGGVGKTRLALDAAWAVEHRFPGGVVHVNLDGVEDAGVLAAEAATALGVVAATPEELGEQLARATRGAPALLILDGVERFLDDAAQVGQLLAATANLTVLATSRAALRLTAEHAYPVHPLAAPNAAVLFIARVTAARPDRPIDEEEDVIVDAICARLDGLPLAIELAADRARLLPLPALLSRLERRLELLTGGPRDLPARQQSLRATLEWSWDVLDHRERTLLGRLTVFEGGASLEAAEAVCNGESGLGADVETLASSLIDKTSLLRTDAGLDDQPRFRLLGTIEEFAAERAGNLAEVELRHARYFLRYCEHAADEAARAHRREWLERLAHERGNIRLAYERLLRDGMAEDALRVAIASARALSWDAHTHEVRGRLAEALAALPAHPTSLRATALYWDGRLAISQARFDEAETLLEAALAAGRELGEVKIEAAALAALGRRAALIASPEAMELCTAACARARAVGDPILVADSLVFLAGACERARHWGRAELLAGEALELYRTAGDPYGAATALAELGWYDVVHRRPDRAEERLAEALELRRRHGDDRLLVEPLIDYAWITLVRGRDEEARERFVDCLLLASQVDDRFIVGEALAGLSAQAALDDAWSLAARLAGASAAVHEGIGAPPWESVTLMQERALSRARGALGAAPFADLFSEGRRLSAEDALGRIADEASQRDVCGASAARGRVADIA
jgi:predicted ATPase/DNA-binding SARP family transcriptional activator